MGDGMKTGQITHHPNKDGTQFSTLDDEIENLRTANALTCVSADSQFANDNRVLRSDATSASRKAQQSGVSLDDSNNMSGIAQLSCTDLNPTNALPLNKGGTGQTTASAAFDALSPLTTRGDIIYRNATTNTRLAAGTDGQRLRTQGSSADPLWVGPSDTIASGNMPAAATLTITSIPNYYSYLELLLTGVSCDTTSRILMVQVSTDNGSSYDSTAGNYIGFTVTTTTVTNNANGSLLGNIGSIANTATQTTSLKIFCYQAGGNALGLGTAVQSTPSNYTTYCHYIGSTSAINAIKVLWNASGNFDAGTYALHGIW